MVLAAVGALSLVLLALAPVILASIELAFELIAVILVPGIVLLLFDIPCENTLLTCDIETKPAKNIAVIVIAPIVLVFINSLETSFVIIVISTERKLFLSLWAAVIEKYRPPTN